jgi:hypothetical protein
MICFVCGRNEAKVVVKTPIMRLDYYMCLECYSKSNGGGGE